MRLATPQQVLEAMGVGTNGGSITAAGAALDVTSRIIENMLETRLEEDTYTDYFDYEVSRMRVRFEPQNFYLLNRFLDADVAVVAKESSTAMRTHLEGDVVLPADYVVNHDEGTVEVLRDLPIGYYTFSVTYTAGFPVTGTEKTIKGAPDWITQAGVAAALQFLNLTPAHVSHKKALAMKDIIGAIRQEVASIVNPYRRERMGMNFPGRSVRHGR